METNNINTTTAKIKFTRVPVYDTEDTNKIIRYNRIFKYNNKLFVLFKHQKYGFYRICSINESQVKTLDFICVVSYKQFYTMKECVDSFIIQMKTKPVDFYHL